MSNNHERSGFYSFDLDHQLSTIIDQYRQDRERYWQARLDQEEWSTTLEMQRSADELADQILRHTDVLACAEAASSVQDFRRVIEEYKRRVLVRAEEKFRRMQSKVPHGMHGDVRSILREWATSWSLDDVDRDLDLDSPLRLLWERFLVDLASEATSSRVPQGARRLLALMDLVTEAAPTASTTLFLRHVSRCFVWGFDSECVILCRGAIDAAFRDAISDEMCETRRARPRNGFGLKDRIEAACPGLIDSATYDAARAVKARGDKAIHYDPEGCADVFGTIRDTVNVISRLTS